MKLDRPILSLSIKIFCIISMLIATIAFNADAAVHEEKVTTQASSGQNVSTWAKVDSSNSVVEAGVTIPYEIIERPPSELGKGPAGSIVVSPFPEIVRKSTFLNHFELNWEMHGHEPKVFMVPHFDFHFYGVPTQEVFKVAAQDPLQPEVRQVPAGYIYPGREFTVPQMGVHAVRPSDLERPFSDVLIFGFYGGKMTFIEPMVTRDRMLEKKHITYDIPVPGYLGKSTRYPTKVDIRYDSKAKAYQIIFSGFRTIVL